MEQRTAQREPQVDRSPRREKRLQRYAHTEESQFEYDQSKIPDGQTYQWCAMTIMGWEDRQGQIRMSRNHWTPVPAKRHPELSGSDTDDGPIIIGGQMLCERPAYLTDEAREEDFRAAQNQTMAQARRLGLAPEGTLADNGQRSANLRRSHDLSVPEDAEG